MENIKKKDIIQKQALSLWLDNNKIGTCEIITGLGKTFIGLHALHTMSKNDGKIHLFLAETTDRKTDLYNDIIKYDKIFSTNTLNDYQLIFRCYQTVYKWKNKDFGLVIADEIHDSLSPAYSKFYFNNKYNALIGLSATITKSTKYEINGKNITKGNLLNEIAPICYNYSIDQGQKDNTSRKLDVYVIYHRLDDKNKYIKAGNKKNIFYQTEKKMYEYLDKQFKRSYYLDDQQQKELLLRIYSTKRSNILYKLKSKTISIKKLLKQLKDKTIIFGNSIDSLLEITDNVVSSRNTEEKNKVIRNHFEKGNIKVIGSFKKLKQGANLNQLDNCIIQSYYSTEKDLIQRFGRLRENKGKIGKVFIFVTLNTKEEDWFNKMTRNVTEFNYIYCKDIDDCIKKL